MHDVSPATHLSKTTLRLAHLPESGLFTAFAHLRQALPGSELVAAASPVGKLGVSICYDMRFPELYQKLTFLHGAEVSEREMERENVREMFGVRAVVLGSCNTST